MDLSVLGSISSNKNKTKKSPHHRSRCLLLLVTVIITAQQLLIASCVSGFSASSQTNNSNNNIMKNKYTTAAQARAAGLFWETPLIQSAPLTKLCNGRPVFLKLDNLQASGSFKDRGMGHLCHSLKYPAPKETENTDKTPPTTAVERLVSSSGGNAGLAVATVGKQLEMPVAVVVPETTKAVVIRKLESLGATVTVHGANWNAADKYTRELIAQDPTAAYISPYDHPLLWTGHSSIVEELQKQLSQVTNNEDQAAAAILVSVGGGGLLCGILEGLQTTKWTDTVVAAAETAGAASFAKAWETRDASAKLTGIDSLATSLGALQVTPIALERALQNGKVQSVVCTDAEAVEACLALSADHRFLVEPACGAALATLYSDRLRVPFLACLPKDGPIVVEVCGGSGVNVDLLEQWKRDVLQS